MKNKISKKSLLLALILLIPFIIFSVMGILKLKARFAVAAPTQSIPVSIRSITTDSGKAVRYISALATLKSAATIELKSETNGRIIELSKREGDWVKAGELLAIIDARISQAQADAGSSKVDSITRQIAAAKLQVKALESQKESAQAAFKFASRELERNEHLFVAGAVSASAIENSRMIHSDAKAKLKAIDAQISAQKSQTAALQAQSSSADSEQRVMKLRHDYSEVRSPADAIVSMRLQEEGNLVGPGAPLYRLEEEGQKKLLINMPEKTGSKVRPGQRVKVLDKNKIHNFVISRIYPSVSRFRQVTVEAEAEDSNLSGPFEQQMQVQIEVSSATGTIIPASARFVNFSDPDTMVIYELTGETANRRIIKPELIGSNANAVVSPETLAPGTVLAVGSYLQNTRLPASFTVEVLP